MSDFEGARIPDPGFAGDDGEASPGVPAALEAYAAGEADHGHVLEALLAARLLVPVVAIAGEVERDASGATREKTSDMATVLVTRSDGRTGMLAFTATRTMAAWDPDARPVPVTAARAAAAALQEGADALVVDLTGPVRFAIERADLTGMAQGWRLTRVGGRSAWIRPAPE